MSKPIETRIRLTEGEHVRIAITLSHIAAKLDEDGSVFLGDPELTQRERKALGGELRRLLKFHDLGNWTEQEFQEKYEAWMNEGIEPK